MPTAFPPESDLFPAGALAPATAKTKWQQFFQAVTGLLGTSGAATDALTALGGLAKAGDSLAGLLKFKNGADIASAANVNLSTATGNTVKITGTTGISAWTMTAGQVMDVIFAAALTLTHHSTNNNIPGAVNITTAAGDRARLYYDGTVVYVLSYTHGAAQAWQSLTGSRALSTTYTNSTGRTITVAAGVTWTNSSGLGFTVAGVTTSVGASNVSQTSPAIITFPVPSGATYSIAAAGLSSWSELR